MFEPLVTDSLVYQQIHRLLRQTFGLATEYDCVSCKQSAADWAWQHDKDPMLLESYRPMCDSCHHIYDCLTKGEKHRSAILCEGDVLEIRRLFAEGRTQQDLAYIYGVTRGSISHIVNHRTWSH